MKLPYLQAFRDVRGKMRFYVRDLVTKKRVAINAAPDDPGFMDAYRNAYVEVFGSLAPREPYRVMHREREQWSITRREPGSRWRPVRRTKRVF